MTEDEVKNAEEIPAGDAPAEAEAVPEEAPAEDADAATEIRDTDIVFDCPHCGHNLAIDYRGAGLQIDCVNCGESVLVPIPAGMQIEDLDLDPGEILKQLFATRRNLQKVEQHAAELEEQLREMSMRRDALQAMLETTRVSLNALKGLAAEQTALQTRVDEVLARMSSDIVVETPEEEPGQADAGEVVVEEGGSAAE